MLNPLPVQGFTDDIVIVTHYERSFTWNDKRFRTYHTESKNGVKASKCAILYGRISGNNWYTGKDDKKPNIVVQNKHQGIEKKWIIGVFGLVNHN